MKIRVLCPHCGSARLIEYKAGDHRVISCVKSPCRRLFSIVQHLKSIAVYSLVHSETFVCGGNQ